MNAPTFEWQDWHGKSLLDHIRLYQDDAILVVNKPAGLLSVPGKGDLNDSLLTRLVAALPQVKLVHRLDRDTSGILVFGLTAEAQRHLSRQFELRQTEKTYQAIVLGTLLDTGMIDQPVRYDPTRPPLHIIDLEWPKAALTQWQAVDTLQWQNQALTRLLLHPITGRSHQLRVHCQSIGHAILGDPLYAPADTLSLTQRLHLHAAALSLFHPVTGEAMRFQSQAPFWAKPIQL